jgi:predicted RNase H-like HicB family nuclease
MSQIRYTGTKFRPIHSPEEANAMPTISSQPAHQFTLEVEQETDGRWIAEIVEVPGVMAYGKTHEQAIAQVQALALRVIADRLEHGEIDLSLTGA